MGHLLARLAARQQMQVRLPPAPRILVIRLDERLGNLLLLTPLLSSLRARFPAARLEILAHAGRAVLLQGHPAVDAIIGFRKRALLAADGPLRLPWTLRRRRYDLCLDAANPTDASATQACLGRLIAARHSVGAGGSVFAPLYSAIVPPLVGPAHEIDLRLQLLTVLPATPPLRRTSLPPLPPLRAAPRLAAWAASLVPGAWGVVNLGARLASKRLDAAAYADLAALMTAAGLQPILLYGPQEHDLAVATLGLAPPSTRLAPPTDLLELAQVMQAARAVISCDTGPMHVAVAAGSPTCGLFVSTDPVRYGYAAPPHAAVDLRKLGWPLALGQVQAWLQGLV